MKLEISDYLKKVKPLIKELLNELLKEYDYASILATDSKGKMYKVDKGSVDVGDEQFGERGFLVRIYFREGYFEYAFNEISKEKIPSLLAEIKEVSKFRCNSNLSIRKYEKNLEEKISFSKGADIKINPEKVSSEEIINVFKDIKDKAFKYEENLLDIRIMYDYLVINKMFISPDKDLEQAYINSMALITAYLDSDKGIKERVKTFSGIKGAEILEEMKEGVEEIIDVAKELLKAEKMIPGEYEIVCTPPITGLIAHEAFGHGVEMDMFVKDRAKSKDYIGKYVASKLVTMRDGAAAAIENGSYFFDDEGEVASSTVIIEKGILKSGINDMLTANSLKAKPTGNGRRQNFDRKAYTRMTNTFIESGESSLDDMIKSIDYGFLIDEMRSGMEDPKNWGIQCMVNIAREIKNGEFTGKIYSPVIMTGYVPDLLKSVSMVSKDFQLSGCGHCGKGYKEYVVVSYGGPYIKCKCRLG
jgi:TldD protein